METEKLVLDLNKFIDIHCKERVYSERCPELELCKFYLLPEYQFVDISGKHRRCRQHWWVSWGHHSSRYSSEAEECNKRRGEVLENHWQNHSGIVFGDRNGFVVLENIVCFRPVGGLGDPSNEDGWHSHNDAAEGSEIRDYLSCCCGFAGEDSLEINLENNKIKNIYIYSRFCIHTCHGIPPKVRRRK